MIRRRIKRPSQPNIRFSRIELKQEMILKINVVSKRSRLVEILQRLHLEQSR
jgi:hypothetical protein